MAEPTQMIFFYLATDLKNVIQMYFLFIIIIFANTKQQHNYSSRVHYPQSENTAV